MLDLRNLETFVWVARLGGFQLAAQKLHTTQPAISARIALLEKDLGVRLLDRRTRRVSLTVKGAELLGFAERMMALRAEIRKSVGDPASLHGVLRLGVPETIVHSWLTALVERINANNPSVILDIEVDSSVYLHAALLADRLDLAFLFGPADEPGLISEPLCTFPLGWFASPKLKLPRQNLTLADLTQWPIITFRRESAPYIAVRQLLQTNGLGSARMFGSSSIAAIVRMATDGIGSCVLPTAVVQRELKDKTLRQLTLPHAIPPLDFHAAWPKSPDNHLATVVAQLAAATATNQNFLCNPSKTKIRPSSSPQVI